MGWSSPVVAGGRVWVTAAVNSRDIALRALAFDAEDGRGVVDVELFRLRRARDINPKNSFASPTPVIDGDRVYVHFGADGPPRCPLRARCCGERRCRTRRSTALAARRSSMATC